MKPPDLAGRFSPSHNERGAAPPYWPRFHRDSLTLPPSSAALPDLDGLVDASADGERRGAVEVDGGGEVVVRVQPLLTAPERNLHLSSTSQLFTGRCRPDYGLQGSISL